MLRLSKHVLRVGIQLAVGGPLPRTEFSVQPIAQTRKQKQTAAPREHLMEDHLLVSRQSSDNGAIPQHANGADSGEERVPGRLLQQHLDLGGREGCILCGEERDEEEKMGGIVIGRYGASGLKGLLGYV